MKIASKCTNCGREYSVEEKTTPKTNTPAFGKLLTKMELALDQQIRECECKSKK